MQLHDSFIDIIFDKVLKLGTLTNLTPVYLKFFDASNVDITNTLFGIATYPITTDKFNTATVKEISNNTTLTVGTSLVTYTGDLTLKIYTVTDIELISYTYPTSISIGSVYNIPANSLKISLLSLTTNLANLLLNYIFRNSTTGKPTTWYLELQNASNTAYQTRILLDPAKFSNTYTDELGHKCVSLTDYLTIATNSTEKLKSAKLFSASTGGTSWFDCTNNISYSVNSGRVLTLYNNSLVLSIAPSYIDASFTLTSNPSLLVWCDYDGTPDNYALNKEPTLSTFTYTTVDNLYKSECAVADTIGYASYAPMVLPEDFVLDFIVKFSTAPSGRYIWMLDMPSAFLLGYALDRLVVYNEFGGVIESVWTPAINTWYHICIYKIGTGIWLYVNSEVTVYLAYGGGRYFNVDSVPRVLNVNNTTYPILGHINHLSIGTAWKPWTPLVEPSPQNAYNWQYLSTNVWNSMSLNQWLEYSK